MIHRKSERELQYMREAGRIVALTLQELEKAIRPGVTTKELDSLAEEFIRRQGAKPAFKGLYGFPASICTSINEEVVHGIPGPRRLREGDIISIDVGTEVEGYHGDGAWTFPVGEISEEAARLLEVTREALYRGIEKAVAGNRLSDISYAIQTYVESHGFSVVRDFVGHGIGRRMHEEPQVPNFGPPGRGPRLEEGMTLAIEPMVNAGTCEVEVLPDNWTVVTKDRRLSAHFEHTIAVRKTRAEILTRP
ncbi:methionine aminopeptidase, type I [Ammonifex degensii KC4]|uniref:Methionine aminopeptidase n=1 Tax=Ammonifex degensii (strain DSM 10501 / KC4) TaxID=429009 RepID=C9R8G9_AMMDK|nr:type I methionyl aminopeptidase [Ammonifex degensii]ACX52598.1 methionine aminopeptidase, type I [Ammonifex degensii KC4]